MVAGGRGVGGRVSPRASTCLHMPRPIGAGGGGGGGAGVHRHVQARQCALSTMPLGQTKLAWVLRSDGAVYHNGAAVVSRSMSHPPARLPARCRPPPARPCDRRRRRLCAEPFRFQSAPPPCRSWRAALLCTALLCCALRCSALRGKAFPSLALALCDAEKPPPPPRTTTTTTNTTTTPHHCGLPAVRRGGRGYT